MSLHYSFDIEIAQKYGVPVAIFLNNLLFWIKKNQANRKNFHDGRYWTYNSVQAYTELFPFWTPKQMRNVLDKVVESGLVVIGNYNANQYDRTCWYALSDEGHKVLNIPICPNGQMETSKEANGFVEKGEPIPDIKPDTKTDKSFSAPRTETPKAPKPQMTRSSMKAENEKKPEWADEKPKAPIASVSSQSTAHRPDFAEQPPGKMAPWYEELMNKNMERILNGKAGRYALRKETGALVANPRIGASLR